MATSAAVTLPKPPLRVSVIVERAFAYALLTAVAVWLIANLAKSPSSFASAIVIGISNGALYALLALGYSLVYGIIELINFAHGDLFMLGTIFSALVVDRWFDQHGGTSLTGWLALLAALILTATFCAAINVAIEFFAYRRLRHAPKLAPLITAVGMSFVLQFVGLKWNGSSPKSVASVLPKGGFSIFGVDFYWSYTIAFLITIPILLVVSWLVTKTRMGKAMRATAQDQDAARLMGVNVNRIISMTFALGGALAGVAAVMYAQTIGTVRYSLGMQLGMIAFTAAVLGGIGSLSGAVLGGFLIGILQALNEGAAYGAGQRWTQSVVFVVLILVMVFRPGGLMNINTKEKV
ncbi:branched-chain amino acid ABC transporter permease [Nocardioides sp. Kera G14]|uniref:branched-chain amino acid ABC transporter permease n=1 Tax=Nocardioides sp. Kera G14 TaxID=2884264 RepID=UPI001D12D6A7|nr:branched-chain amino acid ABC transporter permease [Nocardioides sp. Kera G14]UDY22435.1 branched-chain amino acid ABC transporter permease [Nocardioides sp. Kera G14]